MTIGFSQIPLFAIKYFNETRAKFFFFPNFEYHSRTDATVFRNFFKRIRKCLNSASNILGKYKLLVVEYLI